jgi:hypothetical protein
MGSRVVLRGVAGAVVAAVLAGTGTWHGSASAEETLPAPVLTSPSPEAVVGTVVDLAATSESPFVVFELGYSWGAVRRAPVAAGEDGIFRDTLPTIGLQSEFAVRVRACADASLASCTTPSATTRVSHTVARLVATETWPSVLDPADVERVSLRVTDLVGSAGTVSGAGLPSTTVHDGDVVNVDVPALSDGTYYVTLVQCNPLNESVCTRSPRRLLVRRAPHLYVFGPELFVSQNGDGLWETATAQVFVDPDLTVSARWWIISAAGVTVAGPYELSEDEIAPGRADGAQVVIDPRARLGHPLPAGRYRFEVETTSTVAGFAKSARESLPLLVSNAARITKLTPTTPAFYARSGVPGVPDAIRFGPRLDPDEVRLGSIGYRIRKENGRLLGYPGQWFIVAPDDPVVTWDGTTYEDGHHPGTAPEGTYRIELIRQRTNEEGQFETVYGPVSAPFVLHRDLPPIVRARATATARATWQRTLLERGAQARVGAGDGSLRFHPRPRRQGTGLVTTLHAVRVPTQRLEGFDLGLRLSGAWGRSPDVDVRVATPGGRTVSASLLTRSTTALDFVVRSRWVGADGRLRFKVRWRGDERVRMDKVVVGYRKYDLF